MERIPLLIDTDPGVDDALAILLALNSPLHRIVGLTIAAGNVGLAHTTRNALKLLQVAGAERIPVYAGCDCPLLHPALDAAFVHGQDGFGDTGYAPPARAAEALHAAQAIIAHSEQERGALTLVTLGPLTNLALALRLDPRLPERVKRLVVMGGAVTGRGNITPSAEFNIAFDPEAAHIVFETWPQFELVDWEATLAHPFGFDLLQQWLAGGGAVARFYDAISRTSRAFTAAQSSQWHSADGLAMAVALAPQAVLDREHRRVEVELGHGLYRGATRVDWAGSGGRAANAQIVRQFDMGQYHGMLAAALAC